MPWRFGSRLRSDKDAAVAAIQHLQLQGALMQLATETYNGALFNASSIVTPGDELTTRTVAGVSDPVAAVSYVLPAVEKKLAIGQMMLSEHGAFECPVRPPRAAQACQLWSAFLDIFLSRANLQSACWRDWTAQPSLDLTERMTRLDHPENLALTTAVAKLNELIASSGISQDSWFSINCTAFNNARGRVNLPPLSEPDFRARYLQGLAGGRPRFFE